MIQEALAARRDDVDAIAVTASPGLIGALLVGVSAAKALAWARRLPLVPVNHLHGHVASLYLRPLDLRAAVHLPARERRPHDAARRAGARRLSRARHTLDDAAGEAFDKGARLLGLGYPGGRDRRAREAGDPPAHEFPVGRGAGRDFSFSGLKTALLYAVRELPPPDRARRADLAACYQRATCARSPTALEAARSEPGGGRRRGRRQLELRAGCRAPRSRRRRLHRQRGDDRVGGPYTDAVPYPDYLSLDAHPTA